MKCPVCNKHTLSDFELDHMFFGYRCSECQGCWIKGFQYWRWINDHRHELREKPIESTANLQVVDSEQAKICIECRHLMIRNKVGHGISFYIDKCSTCGSIWLDKNEWEVLKSRNLHDEIHRIFTSVWQRDNRMKEKQANYQVLLTKALGEEDLEKLKMIKSWISKHPHRDYIIAYILHE